MAFPSRYLKKTLTEFSRQKFVLLTGPRQVGKTTMAKSWLAEQDGSYLNWDIPDDREQILTRKFLNEPLPDALVLDEIHKYARWKSWLKGLYDKESSRVRVVVTGSARLDIFQKSGDSLLGRYELLHLHPLSVGELVHAELRAPPNDWLTVGVEDSVSSSLWKRLEQFSGFPEPYYAADPLQYSRWSVQRRDLLVREDIRELTHIRTLSLIEELILLLPERVSSPLSVNSLREQLQVAHDTVNLWLDALERLYVCYRLLPFSSRISRSLRKERKLYLWDWAAVPTPGPRFENMVASHLLKAVQAWNDVGYGEFGLFYWRDREKREVDFVLTNRRRPIALFECKLNDESISPSLIRLSEQLGNIPSVQLLPSSGIDRVHRHIRVVSADKYLAGLV